MFDQVRVLGAHVGTTFRTTFAPEFGPDLSDPVSSAANAVGGGWLGAKLRAAEATGAIAPGNLALPERSTTSSLKTSGAPRTSS